MEPQADVALERIKELEAQLEDAHVTIDLLHEALDEWMARSRKAEHNLALLIQDRRFIVA